jgi:hypothetical protein
VSGIFLGLGYFLRLDSRAKKAAERARLEFDKQAAKTAEEERQREERRAEKKRQLEEERAELERQREERRAQEQRQREKQRAEEERQREKLRLVNIARALAAFPGYWTADRILKRPGWEAPKVADLFPPDVIVECDGEDIEFYKATRVREFEANDPDVRAARDAAVFDIRCTRSDRQAELEYEEYLRKRPAEHIRVKIDDLPL